MPLAEPPRPKRSRRQAQSRHRRRARRRLCRAARSRRATQPARRGQGRGRRRSSPRTREAHARPAKPSRSSKRTSCAAPSSTPASRASTAATPRPCARSSCRGRRAAARPRLGAVHPRRDPGAGRRHARHRPGRADHRRARGRVPLALHAALQFPALCDRRGRPHGHAGPARDRPRQARLARACVRCCRAKESFPYTIRVVSEITEVERLVLDGDGVRRIAVADGCGRAADAAGRGHRHGPDQGRRAASPCCPTSSATRIISATWTSRSPAPSRASPRCRWTSRSPRSPRRSCSIALAPGQGRPPAHPRRDGQGARRRARGGQRATRRASPPSPSRRTRSAK